MQRKLYVLAGALSLVAATAPAQHLFTFTDPPEGPASVRSFSVSGSGGMGPEAVSPRPVRIAADVLQGRPFSLSLPIEGGTFDVATLRHSERRDDGFTWAGSLPGRHLETAVFTVMDGYMVGSWVGTDGRNRKLSGEVGARGHLYVASETATTADYSDWCVEHRREHVAASAHADGGHRGPRSVASASDDAAGHAIDIVFVVSKGAEFGPGSWWKPELAVQHLIDFGNAVFRNTIARAGGTAIKLRSAGIVKYAYDDLDIDGQETEPYDILTTENPPISNRALAIRAHYGADLVHLVTLNAWHDRRAICGVASIYGSRDSLWWMSIKGFGITDLNCEYSSPGRSERTFIHEIGHNLGLNHNLEVYQGSTAAAFGSQTGFGWLANPRSTDDNPLTPTPTDSVPGAFSIMAYKPPASRYGPWRSVPVFSSPYHTLEPGDHGLPASAPDGTYWYLGHDTQGDSARILGETVADIASISDLHNDIDVPLAPSDFRTTSVKDNGDGTFTVGFQWTDNSDADHVFSVQGRAWTAHRAGSRIVLRELRHVLPSSDFNPVWDWSEYKLKDVTEGEATYDFDPTDYALQFWVQDHGGDGATPSGYAVVGDFLPRLDVPPNAPVLADDPTWHGRTWCLKIDYDKARTTSIRVYISWEDEDAWDYGSRNYAHVLSQPSFCTNYGAHWSGNYVEVYAIAKNGHGQARSTKVEFEVP